MTEIITLVFADGTRLEWDTGTLSGGYKALVLQRKKGNPIEVIGAGRAARVLREKYAAYNTDRANYKSDVMSTASEISDSPKEFLESKYNESKEKSWIVRKLDQAIKKKSF